MLKIGCNLCEQTTFQHFKHSNERSRYSCNLCEFKSYLKQHVESHQKDIHKHQEFKKVLRIRSTLHKKSNLHRKQNINSVGTLSPKPKQIVITNTEDKNSGRKAKSGTLSLTQEQISIQNTQHKEPGSKSKSGKLKTKSIGINRHQLASNGIN